MSAPASWLSHFSKVKLLNAFKRSSKTEVSVLHSVQAPNGLGSHSDDWMVVATVLGSVRHSRRLSYFQNTKDFQQQVLTIEVLLPLDTNVRPHDRLGVGAQILYVFGVNKIETNPTVLVCQCQTVS